MMSSMDSQLFFIKDDFPKYKRQTTKGNMKNIQVGLKLAGVFSSLIMSLRRSLVSAESVVASGTSTSFSLRCERIGPLPSMASSPSISKGTPPFLYPVSFAMFK